LLLEAAERGLKNQVEQLIEKDKVEVDCENSAKETPLYLASRNGHVQTMKYLIEKKVYYYHHRYASRGRYVYFIIKTFANHIIVNVIT
jgi:ankyrin repeat protein